MLDFVAAEFSAGLDKVVLLQLTLFVEVKMLEKCLHLLKETAVHEDRANATEEFIKVDILFAALVQQAEHTLHDLWWVLEAQHLDYLDEIEAFNT